LIEGLGQLGFACDYRPDVSPEETRRAMAPYAGLVINSKIRVDAALLDAAPQLRFVARLGSGREVVDEPAAAARGVAAVFSPEGNRNAVAEHALGMLLALANQIVRGDREVRRREWQREARRGWELAGRTVGIVGFGHTGSSFARKLAGFDVRVLAYDKYLPRGYAADWPGVVEAPSLEAVQQQADVVSLHLPLTGETRHLVDAAFLAGCRRGVVIVNTARGACVDTTAVVEALESGQAGGACLDVFENEKPATYSAAEAEVYDRLFALDQVVLTPHVAGWTHESKRRLAEVLLEKIAVALGQNG
jgi:D-3-phosphoglycerate dehydrogenase